MDNLHPPPSNISHGGTESVSAHDVHRSTTNTSSPPSSLSTTVSEHWSPKGIDVPSVSAHGGALHFRPPPQHGSPPPDPPLRRASLWRIGPLLGLFSMFVALACIIASLGILAASDGAAVSDWPSQPSIFLAICTAVANLAMRYACIQGVVIAWWTRARKGSTLSKLHHDWRSGTTLRGAVTAGKHLGLLGLATIFSTLVMVDGPLLQRSSSVISAPIQDETVPLRLSVAQQVPRGYSGVWMTEKEEGSKEHFNGQFNYTMPAANGTSVSNDIVAAGVGLMASVDRLFYSNKPVPGLVSGCKDKCRVTSRAPALARSACTTYEIPVNYNNSLGITTPPKSKEDVAMPFDQADFITAATLVLGDEESIDLFTGHGDVTQCASTFSYTACTLRSAIGEYNVSVVNDLATIETPANPMIVALANNTQVDRTMDPHYQARPATLGGIVGSFTQACLSAVSAYTSNGIVMWYAWNTAISDQYLRLTYEHCPSYNDPNEDMIATLNKLMVYTGAVAAQEDFAYLDARMDPGVAARTNISVTGYRYWGWWRLGRSVSFSPLEIAKAFEAPMLASCDSNATGREAAKELGEVRVKYGSARSPEGGQTAKLAFMYSTPRLGSEAKKQTSPV